MKDVDRHDIYSVAVAPEHCPQCGAAVRTRAFDAGDYHWCDDCELVFARNPLSATHVVVTDGDRVLLLDEPIPQHEGVLSLPGGHARHDEGPREAVLRELEEETGLRATPDALELVTVYPAETPRVSYHFATYALEFGAVSGDVQPEADGFEVVWRDVEAALSGELRLRESDAERIAMAVK